MFNLASLYRPLTAQAEMFEGCLPCAPLKPYVANYWGTKDVLRNKVDCNPLLVIPDTCMDVIFNINHTTGVVSGKLCGMGEDAIIVTPVPTTDITSRFAIRFYFWSTHLYCDTPLRGTASNYNDADLYFTGWKSFFTEMLLSTHTLKERVEMTDRFLLSKLDLFKCNNNVMNALYHTIDTRGSSSVKDVCAYAGVSQRQLERLYADHIGTTVKKTSNLIRYQNVWRDIVFQRHFDVHEAVLKYGYTDQAHLIHSFKRYHTMPPMEAIKTVRAHRSKNGAFLQYE